MKLSHLQNTCRKWLSPDGYETKTRYQLTQIESSVEPITKLCQISGKMFLANGMKGSPQRVFYITNYGIDPFELRDLDTIGTTTSDNYFMITSGLTGCSETVQAIGNNIGTRGEVDGNPSFNSFQGERLDPCKSHI